MKMGQQVKVHTAKPEDLSSRPGTHTVRRENWLLQVVIHTSTIEHSPLSHINKYNLIFFRHTNKWKKNS